MQKLEQYTSLQWILQERLHTSLSEIADFCQRWNMIEFALFGSVLRDDFRSSSDLDVLVVYKPNTEQTFDDFVQAQAELETLFNREVDITQKRGLVNPFSRAEILRTHCIIYPAEKIIPWLFLLLINKCKIMFVIPLHFGICYKLFKKFKLLLKQ